MTLQPISKLFARGGAVVLDEIDVRHFVERYLGEHLKGAAVVCEQAKGGRVVVRAASSLVRQEIGLLEWELKAVLRTEAQFQLRELSVIQL